MHRRTFLAGVGATGASAVAGCGGEEARPREAVLSMTSSAVPAGGSIPVAFTCDGEDVSPPLAFGDVPASAASLAVVIDDPDAGAEPFTHWLVWDIPPDIGSIPRDVPSTETVEALGGAVQGTNDFGSIGYRGPCPPAADPPHTYRFRAFAFGEPLALDPGAEADAFRTAIEDVIVGTGGFLSDYDR
ncbi:MAG: YbhB/YbcL family Raf kinase inhibitor-like protein [Halobacteriaceae archaeon]